MYDDSNLTPQQLENMELDDLIHLVRTTLERNRQQRRVQPRRCPIQEAEEGTYDLMQNDKGELLLLIDGCSDEPEHPRFLFNGVARAVLYRNRNSAIRLNTIRPEVAPMLLQTSTLKVAEVEADKVIREYDTEIRILKGAK